MKKIIQIICLFLAMCSIVSCSPAVNDGERYEIVTVDGQSYIEINKSINFSEMQGMERADVEFKSVDEFIDTVTNGKLTDSQLKTVNGFRKDDNGKIKICDFSNIQVSVQPNDYVTNCVYWIGERYSYDLTARDGSFGYVSYYENDADFKSYYDYEYENFFDRNLITITKEVTVEKRTEHFYFTSNGQFKRIRYTVIDGKTSYTVDEKYRLATNVGLPVSEEVPDTVVLYGDNDGKKFVVSISNLKKAPTEEWIKQFNIVPKNNDSKVS